MPNNKPHQNVIMKLYAKLAETIKGGYSQAKNDYVARLHRNEVSSSPPANLGILTRDLHSSMKPAKTKSSYRPRPNSACNSPRELVPMYALSGQGSPYSPKQSFSYSPQEDEDNY